jgi:hypothetical protein
MAASVKRSLAEKTLMPIVAAGTSAAVGYVVKRAPGFVEDKVMPRVRDVAQGGGADLTGNLVERARDLTGTGDDDDGDGESESSGDSTLSQDELSRRSEERARNRAKRRKTTKSK